MNRHVTQEWVPTLERLLGTPGAAGAELVVADSRGEPVFRAALARHYRLEPHDNTTTGAHGSAGVVTLWLRPIVGGHQPTDRRAGEPDYRFHLDAARRRALTVIEVDVQPDRLEIPLSSGQHATIQPAGPDLQLELDRWDTWVTEVLPATVEVELDELADDSWHGEWA